MDKLEVNTVQINIINNYKLSAFPEDRINTLISELNVHYGKINNYIEMEMAGDKINLEFVDAYIKLNEIFRLSPKRINHDPYSGDFMLGMDIINSILALLQSSSGDIKTRQKVKDLGWDLVERLFDYNFDKIVKNGLFYRWLDSKKLITKSGLYMSNWDVFLDKTNEPKRIPFEPSEHDLNAFYEENKDRIYELMVAEKNGFSELKDPFSDEQIQDFYHYYCSLDELKI
ncbi:hypothetical protein [Vibrio gigantis]|uniref:hypothetical protein n=1 Tax=Vibrio gigantis TaxID=296199 RepID=UPI001BFDC780|nr:hypothetical protein [Vibrio gigantis]